MDLDTFLTEARRFLAEHLTPRRDGRDAWGIGDDRVTIIDEYEPDDEETVVAAARAWQRTRFEAGYAWISGPEEYGGRGLPFAYEHAFAELERGFEVPDMRPLVVGLGMIAPTILAHGSDLARDRYLTALHQGDVIACQLFSEPDAGSDLAAVRTRATRDGASWRLTGQKVWSSGAHLADIGLVLARSDPDAPKHAGLTMLLIDVRAPGVEVRPLRQMTGGSSFNEVFLEEVAVDDDHRVGEAGEGWRVAVTTLSNERATLGAGPSGQVPVEHLARMVAALGDAGDDHVLRSLGALARGVRAMELLVARGSEAITAGDAPGPELSLAKLLLARNQRAVADLAQRVAGPALAADVGSWGTFGWAPYLLGVPASRIAGGTDEILLDLLAERVLGLPRSR
ncbi:MAG: acyl-CoA dehydrogenase family protein [Actinobacteria bacterium]|nr:acyl-CoA dehydrogenase family protein [Actinomycetota bacterium]